MCVRVRRDFGEGAGFYLNATAAPYSSNYRMSDYVLNELPSLIDSMGVGVDPARRSVFGHRSMTNDGERLIARQQDRECSDLL